METVLSALNLSTRKYNSLIHFKRGNKYIWDIKFVGDKAMNRNTEQLSFFHQSAKDK